jgi:hypothetical protein
VKISLHEFEAHDVRAPFLVSWLFEILSQSPTSQAPAGAAAPGLADTRKLCKREAPVLTNIFRSDTSETSAKQSKHSIHLTTSPRPFKMSIPAFSDIAKSSNDVRNFPELICDM